MAEVTAKLDDFSEIPLLLVLLQQFYFEGAREKEKEKVEVLYNKLAKSIGRREDIGDVFF